VAELTSTKQLAALAGGTRMLLLEPTASERLTEVAGTLSAENDHSAHPLDIVLVVGPEGGLSPAEISTLQAAGASAVRLGDTVLRTSTAGPAALAVLNAALHRW
jgi:16S rRNA (uracil1498-N3)-methyltransferase